MADFADALETQEVTLMDTVHFSIVQALSMAGSTFAIGIFLGWILALFQVSGSNDPTHRDDRKD